MYTISIFFPPIFGEGKRFIALLGRPFFIFLFQDLFRIAQFSFYCFKLATVAAIGEEKQNLSVSRGSVVVCTETFAQFEIKEKEEVIQSSSLTGPPKETPVARRLVSGGSFSSSSSSQKKIK